MPVSDVKVVCWLCNEPYNPADMTPVSLPVVPMEVVYSDGSTSRVLPGAEPQPVCKNCLPKLQTLKEYAAKVPV